MNLHFLAMKGRVKDARQNMYCVLAWKRKRRGSENLDTPDTNFQPSSCIPHLGIAQHLGPQLMNPMGSSLAGSSWPSVCFAKPATIPPLSLFQKLIYHSYLLFDLSYSSCFCKFIYLILLLSFINYNQGVSGGS